MPNATWRIRVDWDNNTLFTDPGEDVTSNVLEAEWFLGRDYASQLKGRSVAGMLQLRLLNPDGIYSSFNQLSLLNGLILPRRKLMIDSQGVVQNAPSVAAGAAGLPNGAYKYAVTFVTAAGETTVGDRSAQITLSLQQCSVTNIPIGPTGTTGRNVYRTVGGDPDGTLKLVSLIANNTGTSLGDNLDDASLGVDAPTSNTVYNTQWTGYLDTVQPAPTLNGLPTATLTAYGPLGIIAGRETSLAMQSNVTTDTAFGAVLDDVGWAAGDRSLDTGQTTMTRFWVNKQNALSALRKIEDTEGGFIREGKDGKIYFHKRLYRAVSPYTVSQATYTDAGGSVIKYQAIEQQDPLKEIYNEVRASVQLYSTDSAQVLWTLSESSALSPVISPGESRTWWANYPSPNSPASGFAVDLWTSPASNTDFTANASALGGGADLTAYLTVTPTKFAESMKLVVSSSGTLPAYVTLLQGRGVPIYAKDLVTVVAESTASQAIYLKRTFVNPGEFIPTTQQAQDYCDFNLSIYKDPNPILTITVLANTSALILAEALNRDIGDRITVTADNLTSIGTGLGINTDFFVESIRHHVTREGTHTMQLQCSPASMFGGFFILDSSLLDSADRLAY